MSARPAFLVAALLGLTALAAPRAEAQDPGRGHPRQQQEPPRRAEPRQREPEARPRQDPPRREPASTPEVRRTPPPRSTGEPELRRRKP